MAAKKTAKGGRSRRRTSKMAAASESGNATSANAPATPPAPSTEPDGSEPDFPRSRDGRPKQFSLPAELVEDILLGPTGDRRVLQDSPLLGDVWAAFALDPGVVRDVLITPHKDTTAAGVARAIPRALKVRAQERRLETDPTPAERDVVQPKVAYLQGLVGARLYFDEVLRILVPWTQWWREPRVRDRIEKVDKDDNAGKLAKLLQRGPPQVPPPLIRPLEDFSSLHRYIALAGLIYWIGKLERPVAPDQPLPLLTFDQAFARYRQYVGEIITGMFKLYDVVKKDTYSTGGETSDSQDLEENGDHASQRNIFQISLNRPAAPALEKSVPAVKADAANSLFKVSCKNIVWAVLDCGIDGGHHAFQTSEESPEHRKSRVRKTFDFTNIREIVSSDPHDMDHENYERLIRETGLTREQVKKHLADIAEDFDKGRPVNWGIVEKLITIKHPTLPSSPHGTHVAGIIGADQRGNLNKDNKNAGGMCPDISLYDFRVLGKNLEDTEFAVIAALQYIRYINERHSYITVHGANLSLSILHSVRNFACGRTPVCNECERLVESGVVVVAAAGNRGYQRFQTQDGPFESYAAFSITDPGNANSVITVGSTHGIWPHTYGVSFFSSRGPTGDGRAKPDLVAPGERVVSTVLKGDWAPESGTSMAAPIVSGAAAMLLARYEELIGQPRRVKDILCKTATDLGRDRNFQGHGMLDVLRAFQSI
jgi:serine protease AprX